MDCQSVFGEVRMLAVNCQLFVEVSFESAEKIILWTLNFELKTLIFFHP